MESTTARLTYFANWLYRNSLERTTYLKDLTVAKIEEYLKHKKKTLNNSTLNREADCIRGLLKWAEKHKMPAPNWQLVERFRGQQNLIQVYSKEELAQLYNAPFVYKSQAFYQYRDAFMIRMLVET